MCMRARLGGARQWRVATRARRRAHVPCGAVATRRRSARGGGGWCQQSRPRDADSGVNRQR
jgi:hypothetical protein